MLHKYPLLRVILPFLMGILCFIQFSRYIQPYAFGLVGLSVALVTVLIWNRIPYRYRQVRGVGLMGALFCIAIAYTGIYRQQTFALPSSIDTTTFIAKVVDPAVEKKRSVKIACEITHFKRGQEFLSTSEKCLLYLQKDSSALALQYGDELLFKTVLKPIPKPLNPDEFDYRASLEYKGIRYQSYVESFSWERTGENRGNWLMKGAFRLRNLFLQILTEYRMDNADYGVAAAILLGYDEKLDPELSAHYSGAGVTHVLCVSGMHVGVVFMILNFFLGFLDRKQETKILKALLLLGFVWLYSAITGLSPSVLRSAAMFSFITIGNSLKQKVDTYHSLLASLMFLILLDPFVIFNIGLQLSYFAVFGIVWLQRPIYHLWIPKYKPVDWVWQLMTVSLAAQIITTPISIFYFHQFPNYFILSNLLVVFVSTLVIYLGVAVLAVSFWHWLSNLIAQAMIWMIKLMNFLAIYISDLPGAQTSNIDLGFYPMLLLYLAIFATCIMLVYRSKKMVWVALGLTVGFASMLLVDNYRELNSNQFVVYALNKQTILDIKTSNRMITLCDSATYADQSYQNYQVKAHRIAEGVVVDTVLILNESLNYHGGALRLTSRFAEIGGKRIALIQQPVYNGHTQPVEVDYALVFGNPKLKIGLASKSIHAKTWVFDSSNSQYKVRKWQQECDSLRLNSRRLATQGALVVDF